LLNILLSIFRGIHDSFNLPKIARQVAIPGDVDADYQV
jgi:hypothetical protein